MSRYAVGPSVVVPARVALVLGHMLGLDDVRVRLRGQDAQLDEVLHDWHMVALGERERIASERRLRSSGCDGATTLAAGPQPGGESTVRCLATADVAVAAGVTTAAVTKAARAGRLSGQFDSGRWWFRAEDVATWIAGRSAA